MHAGGYEVVLFDLDGTVSDSAPGILASLRHAFDVNGLPRLDTHTERAILGPPFYESLPPIIGPEAVPGVIAAYREHYGSVGMFDTRAYDGVPELLRRLQDAGCTLAIATSKPEPYAVPIIEHLGLTTYFSTIGGDDLAGSRRTKALVIEEVLARLGHPQASRTIMVGDRSHDIAGARSHGIDALAVAWGYAMPGELGTAAPLAICADAGELAALLLDSHGDLDAAAS
jgi:phosphoglycolate phosphatase